MFRFSSNVLVCKQSSSVLVCGYVSLSVFDVDVYLQCICVTYMYGVQRHYHLSMFGCHSDVTNVTGLFAVCYAESYVSAHAYKLRIAIWGAKLVSL